MKLLIAMMMLFASQAYATGGSYCKVENADVSIEVSLTHARDFGAPIVDMSMVTVDVLKDQLKGGMNSVKFDLTKDSVSWFHLNNDLKLAVYKVSETNLFGSMALIIDAEFAGVNADGVPVYKGLYSVEQTVMLPNDELVKKTSEGMIVCEAS